MADLIEQTPFQKYRDEIHAIWEVYDLDYWHTSFRDFVAGWLAGKGEKFAPGEADRLL